MGLVAAVVGASGYAGGELLRLLCGHPDLEVGQLVAASNAGRRLGDVHPHLVGLADRPLSGVAEAGRIDADVVFLALPHGESAAVADRLDSSVVVDLGADHRLEHPGEWEQFYGGPHAGTWVYGLPELAGARAGIAAARRIASPGCYPTAVALALAPLLAGGGVCPADLVVVAASGTTGAGRGVRAGLMSSEVMGDVSAYKVATHQHTPEMRQSLGRAAGTAVTLSFTPVLVPMPRGILATCTARVRDGVVVSDLRRMLAEAYAAEPFVHLLPAGQWPHTGATLGSNACHLQVAVDEAVGRAVVVAAIDNLGKGAAGQALQNANLALGLSETAGLTADGVAP